MSPSRLIFLAIFSCAPHNLHATSPLRSRLREVKNECRRERVPSATVSGHRANGSLKATILQARQMQVGVSEPQVLRDGGLAVLSRVVGKDVEIRIGSTLITADEAEIRYGAHGEQSDVQLRGNVHLKAILEVKEPHSTP